MILINSNIPVTLLEAKTIVNFELSYFWIKIIGLPLGILTTYTFYLYSKNKLATLIFGLSPLLIQLSFQNYLQLISLIIFILIFKFQKNLKITLFLGVSFLLINLNNLTFFSNLNPKNYTYIIDRRLSFDFIYNSPLIFRNFNLNRAVHNKVFYAFDELNKNIIKSFNFEKMISPWQSQTILEKDGGVSRYLNSFYFWEIPLIVLSFVFFSKSKSNYKNIFLLGIIMSILFKDSIIFMLPSVVMFESFLVRKYVLPFGLLYLISFILFVNFMMTKTPYWVNENDFAQYKIWSNLTKEDLLTNKIIMTDRFGDPKYYYMYYVKPDQIKTNIEFRSFDFIMEDKKGGQIWIGKGPDFREKTNDYKIVRI